MTQAKPLVVLLMALLGTGCSMLGLDRPTVTCPDTALLTRTECAQAVDAAKLVLPAGQQDFTHVDVEARCRPDPTCPQGVAAIILTFAGSGGMQTFVRVFRDTWQAETFIPTPPPAPGLPADWRGPCAILRAERVDAGAVGVRLDPQRAGMV